MHLKNYTFLFQKIHLKHLKYIISIICFINCIKLDAQEPAFFSYKDADLPSNVVFNLYPKDGYMYAATGNGVVRIGHGKTKKLSSRFAIKNSYTLFKENPEGELFVMNFQNQIYRVRKDSLELYIDLRKNFSKRVFSYNFLDGFLYVNSSKTVKRFDRKTLVHDYKWDKIKTNKNQLYFESVLHKDTLFLGDRYIYKDSVYIDQKNTDFIFPEGRNGGRVIHYHKDKYYAINKYKMVLYKKNEAPIYLNKYFDNTQRANYMGSINNDLWISTSSGILIFDPDSLHKPKHTFFKEIPVSHITTDYQGNIWVATLGNGIRVIPNLNIKSFRFENDLLIDFKIDPKAENQFYLAKNNGEILHYNKEISTVWKNKHTINGIFPTKNDLFISTSPVLIRINDKGITEIPIYEKIDHFYEHASYFVGSSWYSVSLFDKSLQKVSKQFDFPYQLEMHKKYALQSLKRGISPLWLSKDKSIAVGSEFGKLIKIKNDSIQNFSLSTDRLNVADIYITQNNEAYVLFTDGAVKQLSSDGEHLTELVNFNSEEVPNKIYVSEALIGVYSTHELFVFDRKTKEKNIFKGLSRYAHEGIVNFQISKTHAYLCTKNSLYSIPIEDLNKTFPPFDRPMHLRVNKKLVAATDYTNIPPDYHSIQIDINYFDETSINDISLNYRFNDGPWIESESLSNEILISKLPHGDYKMDVRIKNGSQSEHIKSISFTIAPYWYQTKLFIGISVLLISIAIGVWIWYLKQIIKTDRALNKAQLTAINAQMKPHFIFNVLNGLQHFILKEDKLQANKIIGEFSRFIRKILDVSKEEMITLEKEIEIIQSYLQLEKIRFKDKFDVRMNTEECTMEVLHTLIPPLLIQPYVENAINHGLLHKNKGGILSVCFKIEGSRMICTIEDNGIGRARASAIQENKKRHDSFYTDANIKRMDLIKGGDVTVIDKVDEDGNATGTIVILKTTLLYE